MILLTTLLLLNITVLYVRAQPTYHPTSIPTSIVEVEAEEIPIAKHQIVIVKTAGNEVIRLKSFDQASFNLKYKIKSLPTTGSLYQLSQVYSDYGYEPKAGTQVVSAPSDGVEVTGSNNRVYYSRPSPDAANNQKWGSFDFVVISEAGVVSYPGTVTLVPTSGAIVGSNFLLSNEGWMITGNQVSSYESKYEGYSRGKLLNHYVLGTDDKVNVQGTGGYDLSLWYFTAPRSKFSGNFGISYGGTLQFSLAAFSGDFSKLNADDSLVVILECAECRGPVSQGITLGFSINSLKNSPNGLFDGTAKRISIPLREGAGWLKDPQNTLLEWTDASQCDIIQVLSRLSALHILGDWTTWYETVGLDDVQISNKKDQLPLCAMARPDASICTC